MAAAMGAVPIASADSGVRQAGVATSPPLFLGCPEGFYEAASGDCVPGPDSSTSSVTAICEDGTNSHSQTRSGTCSGHGGVAQWCPCAGLALAPSPRTRSLFTVSVSPVAWAALNTSMATSSAAGLPQGVRPRRT